MSNKFFTFFLLIRAQQWVKNLFIFLPMFFNKQLLSLIDIINASIAFLSFCLVASAIYCFNDIVDVEYDRNHVEKKNRPIARGVISIKNTKLLIIVCISTGLLISYFLSGINLLIALIIYCAINIAYTLVLKKIIILDVIIIAISFVLRLIVGSIATDTYLSYWIIIMVTLLAFYLAFAKRRDEYIIYQETKTLVRKNINKYSLKLLDNILIILSFLIAILYCAYSLSPQIKAQYSSNFVWVTSIFVILGLLRYKKLITVRRSYANPTKILLKDNIIKLIVIGWLISFYIIIYV